MNPDLWHPPTNEPPVWWTLLLGAVLVLALILLRVLGILH